MKKLLFFTLLFIPFLSISQDSKIFEIHEVDSVAIPKNGYSYLTTFINTNIEIPYMAKVSKVSGYVVLSGVVNEKGKISSIEIIKGLRPDCDKEAIRVFGNFNAWQPALKNNKPVSQKINFRIPFKSTENITFKDGAEIQYLDENFIPVTSSDEYKYVQKSTIDTLTGLVGDINFLKKEKLYATFKTKKIESLKYIPQYPDDLIDSTLKLYSVGQYNNIETIIGDLIKFYPDGKIQQRQFSDNGKLSYPLTTYYKNGVVREFTYFTNLEKNQYRKTNWYANGQIASIIDYKKLPETLVKKDKMAPMSYTSQVDILNQWDENGNCMVKDGNGNAVFKSFKDIEDFTVVTEYGKVANFQKDGFWYGKFDNGGVLFKEFYDKGQLITGVSYTAKGDSATYSKNIEINAQFVGGQKGYVDYLIHNLKYPSAAQRNNAQGKAYVQFVVCTDGSLCDFTVLKSAGNVELDKEAIRVIQNSSGKWEPGIQRGWKVRSKFTLPINFVLSN